MGIEDEVRRIVQSGSARHKRLVEYVVRQASQGRTLADVFEDPYMTNRSTEIERRALLEEPEIVEAVGDDVVNEMRTKLAQVLGE